MNSTEAMNRYFLHRKISEKARVAIGHDKNCAAQDYSYKFHYKFETSIVNVRITRLFPKRYEVKC